MNAVFILLSEQLSSAKIEMNISRYLILCIPFPDLDRSNYKSVTNIIIFIGANY